MTVYGLGSPS